MTHLPAEEKPKVQRFVEFLKERFTVFDPAAIDPQATDLSPTLVKKTPAQYPITPLFGIWNG